MFKLDTKLLQHSVWSSPPPLLSTTQCVVLEGSIVTSVFFVFRGRQEPESAG